MVQNDIKILHVSVAANCFPLFRWELLLGQKEKGYQVEVATPYEEPYLEYADQIVTAGIPLRAVPMVNRLHPLSNALSIMRLSRLMKQAQYDVVHAHQPMGAVLGVTAARLARVPLVFYTTGGFKFHEDMPWLQYNLFRLGETLLLSQLDAVFSVNQEDVTSAQTTGVVPSGKIFYVGARGGCGIDTDKYQVLPIAVRRNSPGRAEFGFGPNHRVVGLVARYVWEKGFREAILAVRELLFNFPELRLLLVGYGKHETEIRHFTVSEGLGDFVVFTGNRQDVPSLLGLMDLFVLPSYREGMPVALLEAMATGLPVIASNVRGSREVVLHNRTGLLVSKRSVPELTAAIERVLGSDSLADRLGAAARKFVVDHHSTRVLLPRILKIYEQLIFDHFHLHPTNHRVS